MAIRWLALLILAFPPQDPADKVKALVEKLGSDEVEVRGRAVLELEKLGFAAVPSLRKAAEGSAGEKKILIDRIIARLTVLGRPIQVSIDAKDRPVREIAADLERQTGIPIRLIGAAANGHATVTAGKTVLWKVVEDLCKGRGDLMYRFTDDGLEIHAAKFRSLPSADYEGMRFVIDRFVWDRSTDRNGLNQMVLHTALAAPRGARLIGMQIQMEELKDDQGKDHAVVPEGSMILVSGGERYGLNSRRFLFAQDYRPYGTPSPDAKKLTRCRGKVALMFAGQERLIARVKNPLGAPSTPAPPGLPTLGIDRWKRRDGWLKVDFTAGWGEDVVKNLPHRTPVLFVFRLKDGEWLDSYSPFLLHPGPEGAPTSRYQTSVELPDGAEIESIDVVVPDPVTTVEIPFDFRDILLR
jgi:hypothetical protein